MFVQCTLGMFMAATLLSMHVHVLPDGRMITHSHAVPESGSEGSHTHTDQDYQFIGAINQTISKVTLTYDIALEVFSGYPQRHTLPEFTDHIERESQVQSGRSPPDFLSMCEM